MGDSTYPLQQVLKTVLEELKLDPNNKQEFKRIAAHLLLSRLYRVAVHCQDETNSVKYFIVKTLCQDPAINDKFDTKLFFKNESLFYEELVGNFSELQELYLDDKYECFQSLPKCFKTLNNDELSILVLEDLTERGFRESSRLKSLSLPELFLLMKELGRFHALTIFLKYKKPNVFSVLRNEFKDPTYRKDFLDKTFKFWSISTASWVVNLAKENFPLNSQYIKKLETFATDRMCYIMLDVISPKEEDEEFNVFNHGDLWVNNLLFHYPDAESEADSKPNKICFIDFQQCRYGSIGIDLSEIFFKLIDQETRDKHKEELLGMYHHSLNEFLKQLGYDSTKIFSCSAIKSQLKKCALYGLGMSFLCLSYNLVNQNDDYVDGEFFVRETTEDCRKRILDVIKESVDSGYL